tara:strand:- start:1191 stop:2591 length:1401 start_codon:yes stop_codon:yes gene_type:complete
MISYRKLKRKRDIEINDYLEYIIGIDLSFQSKERWTIKDKEELFISAMEDDILSPHIIVNLKSSFEMAEKPSSKKLYKRHMDKGLDYLNVDSNNRTITYNDIANDKVSLRPGKYIDIYENEIEIKEPTVLSKLPKSLQKVFYRCNIEVIEYTKIERSQCKKLFRRVNKGMNLNPQELRNAEATDIAELIRNYANDNESVFEYWITEGKINRRANDQLVAQCNALRYALSEDKKYSATHTTLDSMYNEDDIDGRVIASYWKNTKPIMDTIISLITSQAKIVKEDISNNSISWFIDLFMLLCHFKDENIKINNNGEVFKWFLQNYNKRSGSTKVLVKKPQKNGGVKNENFDSLSSSQKDWVLVIRHECILSDFYNKSNLLKNGLVTQVPSDDYFTWQDKLEMWKNQEGIAHDPITNKPNGKKIPLHELYNSKKWQADAIVPRRFGGLHTIDNGQLTSAHDNQSAGAKK